MSYFSTLYKDPNPNNISDELELLKHFPSFFNAKECVGIGGPIGWEEVERN